MLCIFFKGRVRFININLIQKAITRIEIGTLELLYITLKVRSPHIQFSIKIKTLIELIYELFIFLEGPEMEGNHSIRNYFKHFLAVKSERK